MAKSAKTARKHARKVQSSPIALPKPHQRRDKLDLPTLVCQPGPAAAPSSPAGAPESVAPAQPDTASQPDAARQLWRDLAGFALPGGESPAPVGSGPSATLHSDDEPAADPFSAAAAAMGSEFPSMTDCLQDAIKRHLVAFPADAAFFAQPERLSPSRESVSAPDDASCTGRTVTISFTTTTRRPAAEPQDAEGDSGMHDTSTLSVQLSLTRGSEDDPEVSSPSPP